MEIFFIYICMSELGKTPLACTIIGMRDCVSFQTDVHDVRLVTIHSKNAPPIYVTAQNIMQMHFTSDRDPLPNFRLRDFAYMKCDSVYAASLRL